MKDFIITGKEKRMIELARELDEFNSSIRVKANGIEKRVDINEYLSQVIQEVLIDLRRRTAKGRDINECIQEVYFGILKQQRKNNLDHIH